MEAVSFCQLLASYFSITKSFVLLSKLSLLLLTCSPVVKLVSVINFYVSATIINSFTILPIYRISRKFDTELNLAVGDFLWKSPNLIRHMQIQWCFIIQCDRQTAKYNFVKVIRY